MGESGGRSAGVREGLRVSNAGKKYIRTGRVLVNVVLRSQIWRKVDWGGRREGGGESPV